MKNRIKATFFLLVSAAFLTMAAGQVENENDADDRSEVNVTVAQETAVDLDPRYLNYSATGLTPGSTETRDDSNVSALQIENVGSENITDVWMESSEPSSDPFGTGAASNYDAANFMQIYLNSTIISDEFSSLDGSLSDYRDKPVFINRRDYAENRDLSYIFVDGEDAWEYGRFRAGEEEYFWAVENTSTVGTDSPTFKVGATAHTQEQTGTTDFTSSGTDFVYDDTLSTTSSLPDNFGKANVEIPRQDGSDRNMTVIVQTDATTTEGVYTVRSRFNTQYEGPGGSNVEDISGDLGSELLFDSSRTDGIDLAPGDSFQAGTQVKVPRGVPSDSVGLGTLTVHVRNGL